MSGRLNGRVKVGNGLAAAAGRRGVFVQTFLANGHNATQAAITAGYSPRTAYSQGQRLLKNVEVRHQIAKAAQKVAEITGITSERTIREMARLAYSDIRKLFRPDGSLKSPGEWDADMAAAVASFEVETSADGVTTTKVKFWDKNAALEKAMRHLGLFERDNTQARPEMNLQIAFIDRRG